MPGFLVVDDSPTVRLMIVEAIRRLRGKDVSLQEAATAQEALDRFMEGSFDVVFLDLNLTEDHEAEGLTVLRGILAEAPRTRVITLTGLPEDHDAVIDAISMGAFAYVRKPVRVHAVQEVLHDLETEAGSLGRVQ